MIRFLLYTFISMIFLSTNAYSQQCNKKLDPFCEDSNDDVDDKKKIKDMEIDQEIAPIPNLKDTEELMNGSNTSVADASETFTNECSVKNLSFCDYLYFYEQPNEIRYLMFIGLFLLSYLFPLLFYSIFLRNPNYTPGVAAAICLMMGAILIAIPGSSLLLARNVIDLGGTNLLVPFYLQTGNYIWICFFVSVFILLAIISGQSKARNT